MKKTGFAAAALMLFGYSTPALAQSAGCQAINGFSANFLAVPVSRQLTANPFNAGEVITLTASSVTAFAPPGDPVWAFADTSSFGFGAGAFSPSYTVLNTPISETVVVPQGGIAEFGLTEFGPFATALQGVTIVCGLPASASNSNDAFWTFVFAETFSTVSKMAVVHQQQALGFALGRNLRNRFQPSGGSETVATQSSMFLSTQGMQQQQAEANMWLSFSGRAYFDGYEGYSSDVTAGIDWSLGDSSLFGVMIGAGMTDLENAPISDAESKSMLVGIYGAHMFDTGLQLDGYIAYAGADYEAGAVKFGTDRTLAGLALSSRLDAKSGQIELRGRVSGSSEDFPTGVVGVTGATAEQYRVSLGARHDWTSPMPNTKLVPWISLDIEYGYQKDTNGLTDDFLAPRVGFGVHGSLGNGILHANLDVGQTASNVYDAGLELSYAFKF